MLSPTPVTEIRPIFTEIRTFFGKDLSVIFSNLSSHFISPQNLVKYPIIIDSCTAHLLLFNLASILPQKG
jgi:hypothetical protein